MSNCPICGESSVSFNDFGYHVFHEYEHAEPDEEWCDFCGFAYQENGDVTEYFQSIEKTLENIEIHIECVTDIIESEIDFRENKIPRLNKIDFEAWRKKFGWVKDKDGSYSRSGDYWDLVKEGKLKIND